MATGMSETLLRSPINAESFRIKRRAFRLLPPDVAGLLVIINQRKNLSSVNEVLAST